MDDPGFDLLHGFAGLDRCRAGHAANPLPVCLRGVVAQVRIGLGKRLAFHRSIIADSGRRIVSRRYRNRRIGEFLKELDLAEGRSTGVPKILRAMRNNGSPPPSFETDEDRTWFMVRLPVHEGVTEHVTEQDTLQDKSLENKDKSASTPQDTRQDPLQVSESVARLIVVLETETNRADLLEGLGLSDRSNFLAAYLNPALDAGLVEMTLPDKPTSRNQRYRRTPAGEAVARQLKDSRA